ncbi:MAG: hypothetical protein AAB404_01020 [Patescibacteria group bacterium]
MQRFCNPCRDTGQVMLLTTLVVGGLLLGASAIAGLMMVYQIRQSSDVVNSTKAVFAADSGVEWELYRMFKDSDYPKPIMTNQTDFSTTVSGSNIVKSVGSSNRSSRAFEITIQ